MDMKEFVTMLYAIKDDKPFSVNFALQWSDENEMTIQGLVQRINIGALIAFFEKVASSQPAEYEEV